MEQIKNYLNYVLALIFLEKIELIIPFGVKLYESEIAFKLYNKIDRFNIPIRRSDKIYDIVDDFEKRYPTNTIMIDLTTSFMEQEVIIKNDFILVKNILKTFKWSIFVLVCWFIFVGC